MMRQAEWDTSERADWMLAFLARTQPAPLVVRVACHCCRACLPHGKYGTDLLAEIEAAERWASNPTPENAALANDFIRRRGWRDPDFIPDSVAMLVANHVVPAGDDVVARFTAAGAHVIGYAVSASYALVMAGWNAPGYARLPSLVREIVPTVEFP